MQRVSIALALTLAMLAGRAAPSPAQQAADTTLTVEGFLQNDEQFDLWTIVAPLPLQALGVQTFVLPVVGKAGRWSRYRNEYVEARGRVARVPGGGTPGIGIDVENMSARVPPRTTHRTVDHGLTLHADVTLAVIPDRFAWRDAQGGETGVNPIALLTITNRRQAPILFLLRTNDFLCISVTGTQSGFHWDSTTKVMNPDARRFAVQRGGIFRDAIRLPVDAAPRSGRYVARIGICDVDDYDITAEFDVQ
jgi:hypothetical protein